MDFNALFSLLDHQSTVIYRVMWWGVDGGDNSYVIIKMFARWVGECLLKMNVVCIMDVEALLRTKFGL